MKRLWHLTDYINSLNPLYIITVFIFISILLYGNTLFNELFFDDEHFIYNNPAVTSFAISDIFTKSLQEAGQISNYFRPLLFLTFASEYLLLKDTPFIYHFTNLVLHASCGVLLFFLIKKIFSNQTLATSTALFFLIHPIHTEAVSYASGRGDPLSLFFVLLSIYFALSPSHTYKIISVILFVCGLLSKEIAIITPFLIGISILAQKKDFSKKSYLNITKILFPYILVGCLYFFLRITVFNFANTLNFYQIPTLYSTNIFVRINTFFNILPQYLSLLLFPKELFMERDSTFSPYATVRFFTIATPVFFMVLLLISFKRKLKQPIFLFALFWFVISFLPTSGIIPINGIFYEHFLYYPSIGFFLVISFFSLNFYERQTNAGKVFLLCILTVIIIGYSIRTILRNNEWNNPISFYSQTITHAPTARIYNNLAMAYSKKGEYQNAIHNYKKAIEKADAYPQTHYNLANTYLQLGEIQRAEEEYLKSLTISPTFSLSYVRLFQLYQSTNNQDKISQLITILSSQTKQYPSLLPLLQEVQKAFPQQTLR